MGDSVIPGVLFDVHIAGSNRSLHLGKKIIKFRLRLLHVSKSHRLASVVCFFSPTSVVPSIEILHLDFELHSSLKPRARIAGKPGDDGLFACYSPVTSTPNNLGLLLDILHANEKIDLRKSTDALGYWTFSQLGKRLAEKHSRAAFVKARVRTTKAKNQFAYEELVYCDRPSIERFVSLVADRNIAFEFTMSEKPDGKIRNHGYPWRLIRAEFLDQLFAFQIKLR